MLSMIAAESENHVLGNHNQLVWKMPTDTAYFKQKTLGHTILMGRKTFESIIRPLPRRRNLVISRNSGFAPPGVEVFHSLEQALAACEAKEENFIVGGGELYTQGLAYASRIYLTKIHTQVQGDSFFPILEARLWKQTSRVDHPASAIDPYDFSFLIYEKQE